MNALRRTIHVLSVLAWALWMGGFTFYTSVSLRVAHKVLGNTREFGFVTQVVTDRMNLIGLVAVILLLAQVMTHWNVFVRWRRLLLGSTWLILGLTLALLFNLHDAIDALLDFQRRVVTDDHSFERVHNRYELVATIQWFIAVVHLAVMLTHEQSAASGPDQRAQ